MNKIIYIDYYATHRNLESHSDEIFLEYKKMLRSISDKGYQIILFERDTKNEWELKFIADLEYTVNPK